MDLVLDTHVFIWWRDEDLRLGRAARDGIAEPANRVFVSAVTAWEIALKRRLRKLAFTGSPEAAIAENAFLGLPILLEDAEAAGDLDWGHKDPFDRLLVVQARRLGATLVTADAVLRNAPAAILWAG